MASGPAELLLTTCDQSPQFSICLWDYATGNILKTYKGGGSLVPRTLHPIAHDYLIAAEHHKPLLHLWPLNAQEPRKIPRLVLSDTVNCLTISPDRYYACAGIKSKLYTWHLNAGRLLSVQQKHLQAIQCVQFASNGDIVLTAGEDGILCAYNFGDVASVQSHYLAQTQIGQVEPRYTRIDHSMPITDLRVGSFGAHARFATVSLDHTLRIYALNDGTPLLVLVFSEALTALALDARFWHVFVGGMSGVIHHFDVRNAPRAREHHVEGGEGRLVAHAQKITCLALNFAGTTLASGAADRFVYIWNVRGRQVIRKIEHKGVITNLRFMMNDGNVTAQTLKPRYVVKALQRNLEGGEENFVVSVMQMEDIEVSEDEEEVTESVIECSISTDAELIKARLINKQLYDTLLKTIEH